jgi:hypothetical protein
MTLGAFLPGDEPLHLFRNQIGLRRFVAGAQDSNGDSAVLRVYDIKIE